MSAAAIQPIGVRTTCLATTDIGSSCPFCSQYSITLCPSEYVSVVFGVTYKSSSLSFSLGTMYPSGSLIDTCCFSAGYGSLSVYLISVFSPDSAIG